MLLRESANLVFRVESDTMIVRGLAAILIALYSGRPASKIADIDAIQLFDDPRRAQELVAASLQGMEGRMHHGSCLCGAIRFTVEGDLPPASACHCTQCRKHTGHHEAGIDVPRSAVTVTGGDNITWYFSSERVRRGFCSICGSSMFFDVDGVDRIGLNLGSFDGPTNTRIALHIFVADKGDYYDITDGLPQYPQVPGRPS